MIDLLNNPTFSAFLGVVIGAGLSYIAGSFLARKQRRDSHRAAVRAIAYELSENLPKVQNPKAPGQLTTAAYDALLIPLYTDLPDDVAHHVSLAYALIHVTGPSVKALSADQHKIIRAEVEAAQGTIVNYAERAFHMSFNPPQ